MITQKIISMASEPVRLRLLAMERSLRAVGCDLPLYVIPYDDKRFPLPANAQWWEMPEVTSWLKENHAHPVMRKYQCLTEKNYQFVDADVCFLRDPREALADQSGFIPSCGHWRCVDETITEQSRAHMARRTTGWARNVFNTGQFACDRKLYTFDELKETAMRPDFIDTCVHLVHHEQPGINLLVFASGVPVNNMTLPPTCMESAWAGDYPGEYKRYWTVEKQKPYLMHWAGIDMSVPRPINEIFYNYLTASEKAEWDESVKRKVRASRRQQRSFRALARRVKRACHVLAQS